MWRLREIELNFVFREWEPYNGTAPRAKGGAQMPHEHLFHAALTIFSVHFDLKLLLIFYFSFLKNKRYIARFSRLYRQSEAGKMPAQNFYIIH